MRRLFLPVTFFCLFSSVAFAEQSKKVDIFVTSWCHYCRNLETFLNQNQIEYSRHDVEADAEAGEEFTRLGGEGVPLARVGDQIIHGYDPQGILAALNE